MGRSGEVGRTDIWGRFGALGRTYTVLKDNGSDVRHCQQSPIWPLTSSSNTVDRWLCRPIPCLSLKLTGNANGTAFSCSIVDMYHSDTVRRVR